MSPRTREITGLLLFIVLCLGVGAAAGWVTSRSLMSWYPWLEKPVWTPPGRVFGPVWTTLYVMIAVAGWRIWRTPPSSGRRMALTLFAVQLLLNAAWSFVFFGMRSPGWGLVEIVLLWVAVVATLREFLPLDRWAGLLMTPYLLWVSFATALNSAIWWLNR